MNEKNANDSEDNSDNSEESREENIELIKIEFLDTDKTNDTFDINGKLINKIYNYYIDEKGSLNNENIPFIIEKNKLKGTDNNINNILENKIHNNNSINNNELKKEDKNKIIKENKEIFEPFLIKEKNLEFDFENLIKYNLNNKKGYYYYYKFKYLSRRYYQMSKKDTALN